MTSQKRKPKFKKVPTGQIKITNRDIEILLSLVNFRLLRTNDLLSLHSTFSSLRAIQIRLQKLFHHGFVDRVFEKSIYRAGDKPFIYAISTKGYRYLAKNGYVANKRTDYTKLNREFTNKPKEHRLLISELLVKFKASSRAQGVRFIDSNEILKNSPKNIQEQHKPFKWREMVGFKGDDKLLAIEPDRVFGLQFPDRGEGRDKLYFFLEADTGEMPTERKTLARSAIFKKMLIYLETHRNKTHARKFNINNFRVIFYTSITDRVANMVAANKKLNNGLGSRVFLFVDQDRLITNDPLKMLWQNGRDEDPRPLTH